MARDKDLHDSIADSASAKVAGIISAAEEAAAEIVTEARAEAEAIVARARAEAREQVERAEAALAGLATQAGELQSEITASSEGITEVRADTPTAPQQEAPTPAAPDDGSVRRGTNEERDADEADAAGARLVAMNMALEGSTEEEITAKLADEFPSIGDASGLVGDVLARAGRS